MQNLWLHHRKLVDPVQVYGKQIPRYLEELVSAGARSGGGKRERKREDNGGVREREVGGGRVSLKGAFLLKQKEKKDKKKQ
mmetsp:Transcript_86665/g.150891  ORF Transcript_86665/g.150891 Transcript_86665/m.150891 type:complete len:81 (+) Transcript_86665:52-294(+)